MKKRRTDRKRGKLELYFSLSSLLLAALGALLISGGGFLVDHLVHKADRLLASDFYTCGIAFLFSYVLLQLQIWRRRALARRMEIAAEVNHHIRTALTGVVYTAAVRNDPALQAVLEDATARIDWVLNTVLPDGSHDLQWPVQTTMWRPSAWKKPAASEGAQALPKQRASGESR
jgi:hypothetical protein